MKINLLFHRHRNHQITDSMIAITLIYMFAIALFNLSDKWCNTQLPDCFYDKPHCYIYWTSHFYFFTFLALSFAYFYLRRGEVSKQKRIIYMIAGVFSAAYAVYMIVLVTSKDMAIFLGRINSFLWEGIFVFLVVISFWYLLFILLRK
jgi:hypothetical protein